MTRWPSRAGSSRWARAPMAAAITIIPIRWCAAATASCRSTSTCRAARRPPRRCSTAFCCCRRRSGASGGSCADEIKMSDSTGDRPDRLRALGEHVAASLPGAVTATEIRYDELCLKIEREELPRVLRFLRDDPHCRFTLLCDLCGVDYPDREQRFDV